MSLSSCSSSSLHTRIDFAFLRLRILECSQRLEMIETSADKPSKDKSEPATRVRSHLNTRGVLCFCLKRVSPAYYASPLPHRAAELAAASVHHLCKTIVLENKACDRPYCSDPSYSRYIAVVVQYSAKISSDKLRAAAMRLRPAATRLNKNKYNFQLAPQEVSDLLTGFSHNAVSPFGMLTDIPVLVCAKITRLSPSFVYLGGGEVDLKVGLTVSSLVCAAKAVVAEVSESRSSYEDEESVVDIDCR